MWALLLVSTLPLVTTFYVPGVAPMNFHQNSPVEIKVMPHTVFFSFFLRIWVAKEGLEFLLRPNYSFHFKNAKNTLSLHTAGSRAVYLCVDHLFSTDMSLRFYWSRYKPLCLTHRYHSFHRFFLHRFLDLYCGVSNISLFLITRL